MHIKKKHTVRQTLAIQVTVAFIVIAILIVLGGILIFHEMGREYTQFTSFGFIATVYLAFITFQPGGTLFAARKDFVEGKVELPHSTAGKTLGTNVNPWIATLPLSTMTAIACTTIIAIAIYGFGWNPSPVLVILISLLYVVPHYFITSRFIERDLMSFSTKPPATEPYQSPHNYYWLTFVLPNVIYQAIINIPLGTRGFHHEAMKLSAKLPLLHGLVPVHAVSLDLAFTFMFVCNFTFLAAETYTISGIQSGVLSVCQGNNKKRIHGFLMFLIMFSMGLVFGVCYGSALHMTKIINISVEAALLSKLATLTLAVYLGSKMALGWTAKKMKAHKAHSIVADM